LELLVNNLNGLGVGFSYADDVEGNQARESVKLTTDQDLEKLRVYLHVRFRGPILEPAPIWRRIIILLKLFSVMI
jgi:hypothetical protein